MRRKLALFAEATTCSLPPHLLDRSFVIRLSVACICMHASFGNARAYRCCSCMWGLNAAICYSVHFFCSLGPYFTHDGPTSSQRMAAAAREFRARFK